MNFMLYVKKNNCFLLFVCKVFVVGGYVWIVVFCNVDLDGDGMLNGVELGDLNCVWIVGVIFECLFIGYLGKIFFWKK